MKKIALVLLISLASLYTVLAQDKTADESKFITQSATVKGLVEKQMTLTPQSLQEMNVEEISHYKITNHEGEVKKEIASFKGVALRDVIESAKVKMKNPKDRGKYFVVVSASDGYQVVFAYNELMFSHTQAYLAIESEGNPLEKDGKIALYTTSDKITGPRHVKWVQSIEVKKI